MQQPQQGSMGMAPPPTLNRPSPPPPMMQPLQRPSAPPPPMQQGMGPRPTLPGGMMGGPGQRGMGPAGMGGGVSVTMPTPVSFRFCTHQGTAIHYGPSSHL